MGKTVLPMISGVVEVVMRVGIVQIAVAALCVPRCRIR